ncbi:vit-6 [Cordylochernes scorpioides]|uniref:Vit-6 n=1 Tax=Cordylochernes scorpioides TaxID=51811 RepID=A0ABY6K9K8_9ARAC|nr:vit-6 [Cordylochernes scorpioides]
MTATTTSGTSSTPGLPFPGRRVKASRFLDISALLHPPCLRTAIHDPRTGLKDHVCTAYCLVHGNHVRTFDNLTFVMPEIGCYKVIVKDCSPFHHFAVLSAKFSGHSSYSKPSFLHRGRLCGLCGDYDGDLGHELRGPSGCLYNHTDLFSYSHAVSGPSCSVPQLECRTHSYGLGCSRQKTTYIHVGIRERQTCFSVTAIPQCQPGCRATRYVSRTVAFHCLPARDDYTRHLARLSEHRVLHEMRTKSHDHVAEVEFPESCVRHRSQRY